MMNAVKATIVARVSRSLPRSDSSRPSSGLTTSCEITALQPRK